jgi:hypothetical protein
MGSGRGTREHGVIHSAAARSSSFLGGTNMTHVHAFTGAGSTPGPLVIRTIGVMDLKDALARGMSDFSAMPTHAGPERAPRTSGAGGLRALGCRCRGYLFCKLRPRASGLDSGFRSPSLHHARGLDAHHRGQRHRFPVRARGFDYQRGFISAVSTTLRVQVPSRMTEPPGPPRRGRRRTARSR